MLVTSTATDPSGDNTSLEVTLISGAVAQVTDFAVEVFALLIDKVLALYSYPSGCTPTYAVW